MFFDSSDVQSDTEGVSSKLKSKLEKYHSPLNNSSFTI